MLFLLAASISGEKMGVNRSCVEFGDDEVVEEGKVRRYCFLVGVLGVCGALCGVRVAFSNPRPVAS